MKLSLLPRVVLLLVLVLCGANSDLSASNMSRLIGEDCSRCHAKDIVRLEAAGSSHATETACLECHLQHPKQRGDEFQVAACISCHAPEQDEHFILGSCRSCHHAHWPLEVEFSKVDQPLRKLCFSCHENPFGAGSVAHAENLRCNQCHPRHISDSNCQDCHEGHSAGNAEEFCLACHAAHNPLPAIPVEAAASPPCSACHVATSAALAGADSSHGQMSCAECHPRHAQKLDCLQCHERHAVGMTGTDCLVCHGHHQPLPPVFTADTKSALCSACHEELSLGFTDSGAAHQQNLACVDCHLAHPPTETRPVVCSVCHDDEESQHFARDNCRQCHDPHAPLLQDLTALTEVRSLCADCHAEQLAVLETGATAHAEDLDCNQCHERHAESPSCLTCHQGHTAQLQPADCVQCHNPHRPLPVEFLAGIKAKLCRSCHPQTVADFESGGDAHLAELDCIDCHQQHPPGNDVIPECVNCHARDDNQHFASGDCRGCHNPHQPVQADISALVNSRSVCAGCHSQVEAQLSSNASAHDRDCVACHRRHIGSPSCLGCHDPHDEQMSRTDCLLCHQPHAPLQISFTREPATTHCAACHAEEISALTSAGAGHRDKLQCSSCHQRHPAGACNDCHVVHPQAGQGIPQSCFICHPPSNHPHYTVGDCQDCHNPHQPLELDLTVRSPLAPICVSCHQPVAEQFLAMPSGHSQQDCADCHSQHTKIRTCLDCHSAHEETMSKADCLGCHPAHQPQNISLVPAVEQPRKFCAACHQQQNDELLANGGAHLQEFTSCAACHPEHLPNGELTSIACGKCHARAWRRHFTLEKCVDCHNPHQPLAVALDQLAEFRPLCISCHNNQERLYKLYPNKHSEFDCRKCHSGEHGSKMACQDCHQPHLPKMSQTQCLNCHPPHLPQVIKERPAQAQAICAACHQQAAGKLAEFGAAHQKQTCVSCHPSHPPYGQQVIPACAACHEPGDRQHFSIAGCQDCHQGHQPLGHDLGKADGDQSACQDCHFEVLKLFANAPGQHAEQPCNSCHQRHGESLACSDCHQPHGQGSAAGDCQVCHQAPHAPGRVVFFAALPADLCQSCHAQQVESLATGLTAHGKLNCIDCHQGEHGSKLDCFDCHQPPHDSGLHSKFPDCLKCHSDPHDLADWQSRKPESALIEGVPATETLEVDDRPAAVEAVSSEGGK